MKVHPALIQRSEAWLQIRAGRATASEFSRIVTPEGRKSQQQYDYATELVAECLRPDEIKPFAGNEHTERGNRLEGEAREWFAQHVSSAYSLEEVGFCAHDDLPIGCSPDGLIKDASGQYVAGLEIKCPMAKHHAAYLLGNKLPPQYAPQVHGSMIVTGLATWYFLSYCEGLKPFVTRVNANSMTGVMRREIERFCGFYKSHRERLIPMLKEGK